MSSPNAPPLILSHKPATYLERGVAVPFTTPQLTGARIRPAPRTGTEFVLPNPSGGRGVYVLTWTAVRQLCRPTVHDTLLYQRISRLPVMDPGGVRATARQLAAEGVAGRHAALAAAASVAAEKQDLILVNFLLLVTLMEQMEPAGPRVSADTRRTPEIDARARRIVHRVGASIGRTAAQIGADLEGLSRLFVPLGLRGDMPPARLPRLMTRLESVADCLAIWAKQRPGDSRASLAASLSRSASMTAAGAIAAHAAARDLINDLPGLLQLWAATPAAIVKQTSRPEWILDGWERFCLLWETATTISTQSAALPELAQLVPMLPKDGDIEDEARSEFEKLEPALRAACLNTGWRGGGASHGLIARNERLQGLIL